MDAPIRPRTCQGCAIRITYLAKETQDYPSAENTFRELLDLLELVDNNGNPPPSQISPLLPSTQEKLTTRYKCPESTCSADISAFQRSITTLVRYAPTREDALKYLCFFLGQIDPPLRSEETETTMLINIIYVYSKTKTPCSMQEAVDFIEIGLQRGILREKARGIGKFKNPASVFRSVCHPIMNYNKLQFSDDQCSVIRLPNRPQAHRLAPQ